MKNFSVAEEKGQCLSQQFNPSQVCCHQNSYRGEFTANTAGFGLYVQAGWYKRIRFFITTLVKDSGNE